MSSDPRDPASSAQAGAPTAGTTAKSAPERGPFDPIIVTPGGGTGTGHGGSKIDFGKIILLLRPIDKDFS
jgi:hypothetical protein